jgi:hypothetical protein
VAFSSAAKPHDRNRNQASTAQNKCSRVLVAMISVSPGAHTAAANPRAAPLPLDLDCAASRRRFRADPGLGQQRAGTAVDSFRQGRHGRDAGGVQQTWRTFPFGCCQHVDLRLWWDCPSGWVRRRAWHPGGLSRRPQAEGADDFGPSSADTFKGRILAPSPPIDGLVCDEESEAFAGSKNSVSPPFPLYAVDSRGM